MARLRRWRRWLWAAVIAAMIPAAGFVGFVLGRHHVGAEKPALPILAVAPNYTLTNQLGERVSSHRFAGKVQIVTFLFPYCTTMCPLIAAHLANFETLGAAPAGIADKVVIVAFNLDPKNAGLAEMRAFLKQYGWKPEDPRWQFLTGSPAEIRRVVRDGFGIDYRRVKLGAESEGAARVVQPEIVNPLAEKARVDYDITHNDVIDIVDRQGRIRKIYPNADTVGRAELMRTVRALLAEPG